MTSIRQALNNCNSVEELNKLIHDHNLKASIGTLGGRRVKDSSKAGYSGTCSIKDIVYCFKKVCRKDQVKINSSESKVQDIVHKIKSLDDRASLKLSKKGDFKQFLTELKRIFGPGQFNRKTFDNQTLEVQVGIAATTRACIREAKHEAGELFHRTKKSLRETIKENDPDVHQRLAEFEKSIKQDITGIQKQLQESQSSSAYMEIVEGAGEIVNALGNRIMDWFEG